MLDYAKETGGYTPRFIETTFTRAGTKSGMATAPNVSCALIYLQAQIEASIKGICRKLSRMDDPGAISEYLRQNKKILASMLEIESEIDEGLALMSETK